jgi:hypothetical protein
LLVLNGYLPPQLIFLTIWQYSVYNISMGCYSVVKNFVKINGVKAIIYVGCK